MGIALVAMLWISNPSTKTAGPINCVASTTNDKPQGNSIGNAIWSATLPKNYYPDRSPSPTLMVFRDKAADTSIFVDFTPIEERTDARKLLSDITPSSSAQVAVLSDLLLTQSIALKSSSQKITPLESDVICIGSSAVARFAFKQNSDNSTRYYVKTTFANHQNIVDVNAVLDSLSPNSEAYSDYLSTLASFRFLN